MTGQEAGMAEKDRGISEEAKALLADEKDVEQQQQQQPQSQQPSLGPVQPRTGLFGFGLTTLCVAYYAACSSTMLIINKLAIHSLPCPTFLLCIQLLSSAVAVWVGHQFRFLQADSVDFTKLQKFVWVVVGFLGTIWANIKVLQNANVETFITFRSSTPLVLSICDYIFLGRALPSIRSWLSLLVLLAGSVGYVMVDSSFKIHAYFWLFLWYVFFTFDTVYVKHMCDTVKMTNWARVYYTNAIALVPLALALPFTGESELLKVVAWAPQVLVPVVLSCIMGLCMSHSAYLLRDTVSATMFTIVGILCKVITVVINVLIWDKHATPAGIGFLLVCVLAGTFYEQAPRRA